MTRESTMTLEQQLLIKPLTARVNTAQPMDLATFEASGGYRALRLAIKELSPQDVQARVKDANLRAVPMAHTGS